MWAWKEVATNYFLALTGHSLEIPGWGEGERGQLQKKNPSAQRIIYCILDYLTAFF